MVEYCFETCQAPTVVHGRSYLTFRRIIYELIKRFIPKVF